MPQATQRKLTADVQKRFASAKDPRTRRVLRSLIAHLHAFAAEVGLTREEWETAVDFLTATGQKCDDKRQEFILLSDVLGLSMLVDGMNFGASRGATESTVLGPFYVKGAKVLPHGSNIQRGKGGDPTVVSGRVLDARGKPIPGAILDVWQTAPHGLYDVQDPKAPAMNLRGKFRTDREGRFWFRTVKPVSYPVPTDGPVGRLLRASGRHPFRPAHLHFIVSAKGYETLTTHLFVKGDRYLDSDAVFGVKPSLIVDFKRRTSKAEAQKYGLKSPFYEMSYDFGLMPARKARGAGKAAKAASRPAAKAKPAARSARKAAPGSAAKPRARRSA